MREDFISYSPGFYGLYEKRNEYLNKINFNDFNDNDIKLFILGKYYDLSSEYMWWNYDLEKYLCKEKKILIKNCIKLFYLFLSQISGMKMT